MLNEIRLVAKSQIKVYFSHVKDYERDMTQADIQNLKHMIRSAWPGFTITDVQMKYVIANVKKSVKQSLKNR